MSIVTSLPEFNELEVLTKRDITMAHKQGGGKTTGNHRVDEPKHLEPKEMKASQEIDVLTAVHLSIEEVLRRYPPYALPRPENETGLMNNEETDDFLKDASLTEIETAISLRLKIIMQFTIEYLRGTCPQIIENLSKATKNYQVTSPVCEANPSLKKVDPEELILTGADNSAHVQNLINQAVFRKWLAITQKPLSLEHFDDLTESAVEIAELMANFDRISVDVSNDFLQVLPEDSLILGRSNDKPKIGLRKNHAKIVYGSLSPKAIALEPRTKCPALFAKDKNGVNLIRKTFLLDRQVWRHTFYELNNLSLEYFERICEESIEMSEKAERELRLHGII